MFFVLSRIDINKHSIKKYCKVNKNMEDQIEKFRQSVLKEKPPNSWEREKEGKPWDPPLVDYEKAVISDRELTSISLIEDAVFFIDKARKIRSKWDAQNFLEDFKRDLAYQRNKELKRVLERHNFWSKLLEKLRQYKIEIEFEWISQGKKETRKWNPPLTEKEKAIINDSAIDDILTLMEIVSFISYLRKKEATPFLSSWIEFRDNPEFTKVKQILENHGNLLAKQIEIETKAREELKDKLIKNWDKLSFRGNHYIIYPAELIDYPPAEKWGIEDKERKINFQLTTELSGESESICHECLKVNKDYLEKEKVKPMADAERKSLIDLIYFFNEINQIFKYFER